MCQHVYMFTTDRTNTSLLHNFSAGHPLGHATLPLRIVADGLAQQSAQCGTSWHAFPTVHPMLYQVIIVRSDMASSYSYVVAFITSAKHILPANVSNQTGRRRRPFSSSAFQSTRLPLLSSRYRSRRAAKLPGMAGAVSSAKEGRPLHCAAVAASQGCTRPDQKSLVACAVRSRIEDHSRTGLYQPCSSTGAISLPLVTGEISTADPVPSKGRCFSVCASACLCVCACASACG